MAQPGLSDTRSEPREQPPRRRIRPVHVAGAYTAVGLAWIFISDTIAHGLTRSSTAAFNADVIKGSLFVVLSGVLVFVLASRLVRSADASEKRAEASRRQFEESKRLLEAFSAHCPASMYLVGDDGRIRMVNPRTAQHLGRAPEALVGVGMSELFDPAQAAAVERQHAQILTSGSPEMLEEHVRLPDGQLRHFSSFKFPVFEPGGRAVAVGGFSIDVTDTRRAEARYRLLFEHTSSGITINDKEGRYLEVNPEGCRLLGASRDEILRRTAGELDLRQRIDSAGPGSEAAAPDAERSGVMRFRNFAGEERAVDFVAHPLPDGTYLTVFSDATARLREERVRAEYTRALEMLAGDAPLSRILEEIVRTAEQVDPRVLGSVVLLGDDGRTMRRVVAPSMPRAYSDALLGVEIGPDRGSCGTSMFTGLRVVAHDIETDPRWADFRTLTREHGLRACWSEPIRLASGEVVGSFAMYYREPRSPSESETAVITGWAHLVGIAIQRDRAERTLKREAELFTSSPIMFMRWGAEPGWPIVAASRNVDLLGYDRDALLRARTNWLDLIHPDDRDRIRQEIAEFRRNNQDRHSPQSYRLRAADGAYRDILDFTVVLRDERGAIHSAEGYLLDVTEHVQTRRMLERIEKRYEDLYETTPAMLQSIGPDRRLLSVSNHWLEMMGYRREEVIGRPVTDFISAESARRASERDLPEFFRTGYVRDLPYQMVRKDGSIIEVLLSSAAERDEQGNFVRSCAVMVDVTALKRSMEDLRQSQWRAGKILEGANAIFWEAELDASQFVFAAGRVREILGYEPEEMLRPGFWPEMVHPEDRERAAAFCREESLAGRDHELEYRALRKDGTTVWLRDIVSVKSSNGEPAYLTGVLLDVSSAKAAEAAVRDSQARLSRLVAQSPVAIFEIDPRAQVLAWNPAAERIFGWKAEEMIGRKFWPIVPPHARPAVERVWNDLVASRGGWRSTNQNITKDGRIIDCEWYNAQLTDDQGHVLGIVAICEDVTVRKQAERRQALMLAELDHRVKNNLATILSLADQTARNTGDTASFLRAFSGRLRALARMHAQLASQQWRGMTLDSIARQTLTPFAPTLETCRITGPRVTVSPRYAQSLTLALHELATNAAKYGSLSAPGGEVRVEWTLEEPAPAEERPRVLLHWTESGGPPVSPPTRTGFGTELIQGMVEHELHGKAQFDFVSPGLRCRFEFPLESEDPEAPAAGGLTGRAPGSAASVQGTPTH